MLSIGFFLALDFNWVFFERFTGIFWLLCLQVSRNLLSSTVIESLKLLLLSSFLLVSTLFKSSVNLK